MACGRMQRLECLALGPLLWQQFVWSSIYSFALTNDNTGCVCTFFALALSSIIDVDDQSKSQIIESGFEARPT